MKIIKTIFVAMALMLPCNHLLAQKMNNNALSPRQQALAAVACLEAKGDIENLKPAIARALDDGLTVNEIKEALSHLYAYTGFPRSLNGLGALQAVTEQRKQQGITDVEGRDASPLPAGYDALTVGTAVQTKLSGKPFNYTFAPATDYYLKAHLFGDIFARDVLSHADREIVTVSALAGIEGVKPQLLAHAAGALNMGVTAEQLRAIPATLNERVGAVEAIRAEQAIAQVLGHEPAEAQYGNLAEQPFPKGELNTAYAKYFIGNSYLAPLAQGEGKLPVANVTFEPRCRNNWHIHHKGGQILICVSGRGWYQEWGKPARELKPGDVVDIPAEAKHWHGAAADSWFQHIAIGVPAQDAATTWLEPVSDEEYNQLEQ